MALALAVAGAPLCFPVASLAQGGLPNSGELVEKAEQWDGRRVTFTGEAVGGAMYRGDVAWLHLNDDAYAEMDDAAGGTVGGSPEGEGDGGRGQHLAGYNAGHAVLVSRELAARVTRFGNYGVRGDIVRVEGTFHAADPRYGGDMLIEAESLTVVRQGRDLPISPPVWKFWCLLGLSLTTAAAYTLLVRRRRGTLFGSLRLRSR